MTMNDFKSNSDRSGNILKRNCTNRSEIKFLTSLFMSVFKPAILRFCDTLNKILLEKSLYSQKRLVLIQI